MYSCEENVTSEVKPAKTNNAESSFDASIRAPGHTSLLTSGGIMVPPPEEYLGNSTSPRPQARKHLSQPTEKPSDLAWSTTILPMELYGSEPSTSGKLKDGRPPRAPAGDVNSLQRPVKDNSNAAHCCPTIVQTREPSTGESSLLVGVTDTLVKRSRPRGVSFGEDIFELSPGATPSGLVQVQAKDQERSPRHTRTDDGRLSSRVLSPNQKVSNDTSCGENTLVLVDVVNPMESEAEKAIFTAIEERERNAALSTATMVFPNLPEDVVVSFQSTEISSLRSSEVRTSFVSQKSKRVIDKEKSKGELQSDSQKQKVIAEKLKNQKSSANLAVDSMEDTLYNLANQLRNIHSNEDHFSHDAELNEESDGVVHPMANAATEPIRNQADLLANDAALLFRGPKKVFDSDTQTSLPSWSMETDPKKNDDIMISEGHEATMALEPDLEQGNLSNGESKVTGVKPVQSVRASIFFWRKKTGAKDDMNYLESFFVQKKRTMTVYAKSVFVFLMLPATAIAAILYYGCGNPLMKSGKNAESGTFPSVSWFLLFLCVRQVITFSLAKLTEIFIIDFLAMKTRLLINVLGPLISLLIVQSKGWPCTLTFWTLYDLIMLSGEGPFANHWAFYQDFIGLFNERNPSGGITSDPWNYKVLIAGMVIGIVTSIKRFAVGMSLGGKQYSTYGAKLAEVIQRMILVSEVASLARKLEHEQQDKPAANAEFNWDFPSFGHELLKDDDDEDNSALSKSPRAIDESKPYTRSLSPSERGNLLKLLDQWEEPLEGRNVDNVSITAILNFKQTLEFMDLSFPFSKSFGLADTREHCAHSAERLYNRLLHGNPQFDTLQFETLATLARAPSSQEMNDVRLKEIIKVFRPERDGSLDMLAFVRSVDQVYKDFKLLKASIRNSSQIDHAFEAIINVGFFFVIFCAVLASWGIDPLAMFLSFSSVILAFSFAIGSASAKYFEGLMFILGRSPYDIGDRISINSPNEPPGSDGVFTWYVEEVTLYFTTVRLGATNEVATISNSALANSRIVNAARSNKAMVYIKLKFGIDVPYSKIQVFKEAVESFVKARPREWLNCSSIRPSRVEADFGFIEYVVCLLHRDSWQHLGTILESKAAVMSFCLEVTKKLGMRYVAPSTPVDLTMKNAQFLSSFVQGAEDISRDSPGANLSPLSRVRSQSADIRSVVDMFTVASS